MKLSDKSTGLLKQFLQRNGVSDHEMSEAKAVGQCKVPKKYYYGFAIFKVSVPPRISVSHEIMECHKKLPITSYRHDILDKINSNRVIIISGDTGSGKTTQVPQYILEDHCLRNEPCRIVCTQPRRIAAVSMADRVAYERSEEVGYSGKKTWLNV